MPDAAGRAYTERLQRVVLAKLRRLEIQLRTLELAQRLAISPPPLPPDAQAASYDVFISYATEDGAAIARPLGDELQRRGVRVWIDRAELRIGDSLMDTIQSAIGRSRFGVVVLSPSFFGRRWPRRELNALAALADEQGRKVILPVWHNVDHAAVVRSAPLLADVYAPNSQIGIPALAELIEEEVRQSSG